MGCANTQTLLLFVYSMEAIKAVDGSSCHDVTMTTSPAYEGVKINRIYLVCVCVHTCVFAACNVSIFQPPDNLSCYNFFMAHYTMSVPFW